MGKRGGRLICEVDTDGPAGLRCLKHGGGPLCNIQDCDHAAEALLKEKDEHGNPGLRCGNHRKRPAPGSLIPPTRDVRVKIEPGAKAKAKAKVKLEKPDAAAKAKAKAQG